METKHSTFRLATSVLALIDAIAEEEQRARRIVIERAIREYYEKHYTTENQR